MAICENCHREFDSTNRSCEDWFQLNNFHQGFTGKEGTMITSISESWNYCSWDCLMVDIIRTQATSDKKGVVEI